MIEVSVQPTRLVAGQSGRLLIRFANTGPGTCTDINFSLEAPSSITLMAGRKRVKIPMIPAGRAHVHEVTVRPGKPGEFVLTSFNFSYRESGAPVRDNTFRHRITVQPPEPPPPVRPLPRLVVEHSGRQLALGEYDDLVILVRNVTGVPLSDLTVTLTGPFEIRGNPARVAPLVLRDGATGRAQFSFHATVGGRVPVDVRTAFSYPDGLGKVRWGTQNDSLKVAVAAKPGPPAAQTILYLAACPPDNMPLRWDEELRMVKNEWQAGRERDRFRVEDRTAVRLIEITRALDTCGPRIMHFSGHGEPDGSVYVEYERGVSELATAQGLARLVGGYAATLKCVVVNACHSLVLADAVGEHVDYVVGMRAKISDEAGILFSVGFYQHLFAGYAVPEAFEQGCSLIEARPAIRHESETLALRGRRAR